MIIQNSFGIELLVFYIKLFVSRLCKKIHFVLPDGRIVPFETHFVYYSD